MAGPEERSDMRGVPGAMTGSRPPNGIGQADVGAAERRSRYVAALLVVLTVTLTLLAAGLWVRAGLRLTSDIPPVVFPFVLAAAVAYAVVGAVIVIRRPERNVGWMLGTLGLLVSLTYLGLAFVSLEPVGVISPDSAAVAAVLTVSIAASMTIAVGATFGFIFPTGQVQDRTGRWGVRLTWLGAAVIALGHILNPGPVFILRDLQNPLAPAAAAPAGRTLLGLGVIMLMGASFLAAASLLARYRASDTVSRRQIRLVVGAAGGLAFVTVLFLAAAFAGSSGPLLDITTVALAAALLISPLAILLAMDRYRLYELDHLVGRTFVIATTTAILAGVFAATQRLLQVVFTVVLGESSDLTYVVSSLLVVTAIYPLKEHLEGIVDGWDDGTGSTSTDALDARDVPEPEPQALDPTLLAIIDTHIEQRLEEWLILHDRALGTEVHHVSLLSSHDATVSITPDATTPPDASRDPGQ